MACDGILNNAPAVDGVLNLLLPLLVLRMTTLAHQEPSREDLCRPPRELHFIPQPARR